MPQHLFFDLDKTLTVSRSPMMRDHHDVFEQLCNRRDVVVVTGGTIEQIREQVTSRFDGKYCALAQSGNHAIKADGVELWREHIDDQQTNEVMLVIEMLKKHFSETVRDENDLVEHRGAQISYSVTGFHENIERKYAFDPDDSRRATALRALPDEVKRLRDAGIEVMPAGTTTYNFILAGKDKGHNVKRLIVHEGWGENDCVYVGDALFPGGNDESVIGVIPTYAVKNPEETFAFVSSVLE